MSTKNLLIVDDSPTTRMLITLTLKKNDAYRIVEAADGQQAVAKLGSEQIDLVLTDIGMPNMNGLELISYIRARHPGIPIIVITTKGEEQDLDRGFALGANAYLPKPISGARLQSLVKELLAEAGSN
jgi:two-component system chemotaxis response regulator CheY